jgi:uncharacterized membrane protein YhaH (DUF805 family)
MTIFGSSRLGRLGYVIAIILMLTFDLIKGPVERYLVKQHDLAAEQLLAPRPVTDSHKLDSGELNGREMPFMLKAHQDIVRDLAGSGRKMSKAELEAEIGKRLARTPPISSLGFETNKPVPRDVGDLAERRSFFAAAFPIAVLVMTAATIVALLWMVSSRLRDIGWPQYLLWLLIAPIFVPKFLALPLSPVAAQLVGLVFYMGVAFIALIPGEGQRPRPVPAAAGAPTVVRRRPTQFGRLSSP